MKKLNDIQTTFHTPKRIPSLLMLIGTLLILLSLLNAFFNLHIGGLLRPHALKLIPGTVGVIGLAAIVIAQFSRWWSYQQQQGQLIQAALSKMPSLEMSLSPSQAFDKKSRFAGHVKLWYALGLLILSVLTCSMIEAINNYQMGTLILAMMLKSTQAATTFYILYILSFPFLIVLYFFQISAIRKIWEVRTQGSDRMAAELKSQLNRADVQQQNKKQFKVLRILFGYCILQAIYFLLVSLKNQSGMNLLSMIKMLGFVVMVVQMGFGFYWMMAWSQESLYRRLLLENHQLSKEL